MPSEHVEKHPSFGQLSFCRRSHGGETRVYGSSIGHRSTVVMTISHSEKRRDLNRTWYFPDKTVVEIEMSQSQFAEAISSLNMGGGVPCSIRYIEGKGNIEPTPYENVREVFETELKEKLKKTLGQADALLEEASGLLGQKSVRKRDLAELLNKVERIKTELHCNFPFIYDSFNEQMDNTVTEAKGEIEAFTEMKLMSAGLAKFKEQAQVLLEGDTDDKKRGSSRAE